MSREENSRGIAIWGITRPGPIVLEHSRGPPEILIGLKIQRTWIVMIGEASITRNLS